MPDPAHLAVDFYREQALRGRVGANEVQRVWRTADRRDLTGWFEVNAPDIVVPILQGMVASAFVAPQYVAAQADEQGVAPPAEEVDPEGFAADAAALASMAYSVTVLPTKAAVAQGIALTIAQNLATKSLVRLASTLISDAGREATQAAMVSSGFDGYVRMLQLPSCPRCAVQAGKWFRWNVGFERHPGCDCVHVPAAESRVGDLSVDPLAAIRAGKVRGLSKADTQAILDGADVSQVINAHRGMATSDVFGRTLKTTTEGVTRRGLAHQSMAQARYVARQGEMKRAGTRYREWRSARLTPSAIYDVAENKADALRLLRLYGYIRPE